eukprot:Opistho-1_new@28744
MLGGDDGRPHGACAGAARARVAGAVQLSQDHRRVCCGDCDALHGAARAGALVLQEFVGSRPRGHCVKVPAAHAPQPPAVHAADEGRLQRVPPLSQSARAHAHPLRPHRDGRQGRARHLRRLPWHRQPPHVLLLWHLGGRALPHCRQLLAPRTPRRLVLRKRRHRQRRRRPRVVAVDGAPHDAQPAQLPADHGPGRALARDGVPVPHATQRQQLQGAVAGNCGPRAAHRARRHHHYDAQALCLGVRRGFCVALLFSPGVFSVPVPCVAVCSANRIIAPRLYCAAAFARSVLRCASLCVRARAWWPVNKNDAIRAK